MSHAVGGTPDLQNEHFLIINHQGLARSLPQCLNEAGNNWQGNDIVHVIV